MRAGCLSERALHDRQQVVRVAHCRVGSEYFDQSRFCLLHLALAEKRFRMSELSGQLSTIPARLPFVLFQAVVTQRSAPLNSDPVFPLAGSKQLVSRHRPVVDHRALQDQIDNPILV